VIFVTHDIDEAIKMGDRIAIMREGHLIQWGTADELLASPANDFVASFVGADRGLKRLSVWTARDVELEPVPADRPPESPTARAETSLRDLLSLMLTEGTSYVDVTDESGAPIGRVRMETITQLVGPDSTTPGAEEEVARV
jgi:osmoprotectant transport system ATP-binding protein